MTLKSWQRWNACIPWRLVFQVGCDSGFFSEYNNMLIAIHFCLVYPCRFVLCSKWANFGFKNGWTDYFEPFCKEENVLADEVFNRRFPFAPKTDEEKAAFIRYNVRRFLSGKWLLTWHMKYFRRQHIDEQCRNICLGLNGTLPENLRQLNDMVWHYNAATRHEVSQRKLHIAKPYIALHIRRGDKVIYETETFALDAYINRAAQCSAIRTAFVATDDYGVYETLCRDYPEWKFYTLTTPSQRGYDQGAFQRAGRDAVREDMLNLFATIETMADSQLFIGTMSSNIGMYMYWRMPKGKCLGVDFDDWRIW